MQLLRYTYWVRLLVFLFGGQPLQPVRRDEVEAGGHPNHHITINNHQRKGPPEEVKLLMEKLRKKNG